MPDKKSAAPALTDPKLYQHWYELPIRFGDQDSLGHVNNVAFIAYAEDARIAFSRSLGQAPGDNGLSWAIARVSMEYLAELRYPGTVRVGTAVGRLGNSSCTLVCGVFDGDRCVGTSDAVLVLVSSATHKPTPIPPPLRGALEMHLVRSA